MKLDLENYMLSTGISSNDLERVKAIIDAIDVKFICIDIANGYLESLIEFCSVIRKLYPD